MKFLIFSVTLCLSWLTVQAIVFGSYVFHVRRSGHQFSLRGAIDWLQSRPPLQYGIINGASVCFEGICSFSVLLAATPLSEASILQAMTKIWRFAVLWALLVGVISTGFRLARSRILPAETPDR